MRNYFLPHARRFVGALLLCVAAHSLSAQTLARPGWAGSGLSAETWWRNAVFYRITPATFQDSDGDGKGDLRGIAQRMVYLQSLGVDAVVLETPFDESGFDDLIGEASRHHIRLLVVLPALDNATVITEARSWLTRGCAGIWLRVAEKSDGLQTAEAVRVLRKLTDSFPGQRVLVEDTSADPAALAQPGAQLVTRVIEAGIGQHTDALSLRVQLAQLNNIPQGSAPVVVLQHDGTQTIEEVHPHDALQKIRASALLLSHSAAVLNAGQEINLPATTDATRVMQWTPTNVTREPAAERAPAPPPQPRREDDYGAFVPYVAPKKPVTSTVIDLNALPGFSSIALQNGLAPTQDNVAAEDVAPDSLLNFYRRLSQLHHEDATLRLGAMSLLNRDADDVLAWVRRPPVNARTSSAILVACNLSDSARSVSFVPDFAAGGARTDGLEPVLSSSALNAQYLQHAASVRLAAWSVVVLSPRR